MKSIFNKRLRFSPLPEVDSYSIDTAKCDLEQCSIYSTSALDQSDSSVFLPFSSAHDFGSSSSSLQSLDCVSDALFLDSNEYRQFNHSSEGSHACPNHSSPQRRFEKVLSICDHLPPSSLIQRSSTPPPPLFTTPLALSHQSTSVPLFMHSSELRRHRNNNGNYESGSGNGHTDISALELCEAVSRAEMWTQRSILGLQEHTRSLLAATEAEERRLRARLAKLQNEISKGVGTEETKCSVESPSLGLQVDEVNTTVDSNTSAVLQLESQRNVPIANLCITNTVTNGDDEVFHGSLMTNKVSLKVPSEIDDDPCLDRLPSPNSHSTPRCYEGNQDFPKLPSEVHSRDCQDPNPSKTSRRQSNGSSEVTVIAAPKLPLLIEMDFPDNAQINLVQHCSFSRNALLEQERVENDKFSNVTDAEDLSKVEKKSSIAARAPEPSSPHTEGSFTEVSSLELPKHSTAMKRTLVDLLEEESKQLKAAKETYKSKKKVVIGLKALLQQDLNFALSETSTSSTGLVSKAIRHLSSSVSVSRPENFSEPPPRQEIFVKPRQHFDYPSMKSAESIKPDVDRLYTQFIRKFCRSRITRVSRSNGGEGKGEKEGDRDLDQEEDGDDVENRKCLQSFCETYSMPSSIKRITISSPCVKLNSESSDSGGVHPVNVRPDGIIVCTRCRYCLHYISCCPSTFSSICPCNHRVHPCHYRSAHFKSHRGRSRSRYLNNNHIGASDSKQPQRQLDLEAVSNTNIGDEYAYIKPPPVEKRTKPVILDSQSLSSTSHQRPACKDNVLDPTVRFNAFCTDPPYAYDRESALNRNTMKNESILPKTLQEAFRLRMQAFIIRSEARQRLIRLEALERRVKAEQKALKATDRSRTPPRSFINPSTSFELPQVSNNVAATTDYKDLSKKLRKSVRKPLAPSEAHRLLRLQQNSRSLINRERMKKFSEDVRRRLLGSCPC